MPLKKRILKHPFTQKLISWLLAQYIRLVYITSFKTYHFHPAAIPYMKGEDNAIFAFWHGRMMMCPTIEPHARKMHVLISHHRDGQLISEVISHFGESTISGSSSRGGMAAVKEILRVLKNGDNVSITPDGPRGPIQIVQPGVVTTARLAGKPVLPVTFSTSHCKRMRSWDRFMLAYPFGRIVFYVGAPIPVARDIDAAGEEAARFAIEHAMNELVKIADRHYGHV